MLREGPPPEEKGGGHRRGDKQEGGASAGGAQPGQAEAVQALAGAHEHAGGGSKAAVGALNFTQLAVGCHQRFLNRVVDFKILS